MKVTLSKKPDNVVVCHWYELFRNNSRVSLSCPPISTNCKRAGGGPYSMNFFVDDGQWEIEDSQKTLTEYLDLNTDSGNTLKRFFCRMCGSDSPVKSVAKTLPGKALIKASLFDEIPTKRSDYYEHKAIKWNQN
ncbi:putative conserved hypothetical protein [Colletotrichum sublineola]|uniref:CENP-V/GFA domain-containing protein n=1 Tax=Colletotrichum sublineola TaxID=1173701 RepID=A0A066WZ49_COLSU|nr:putative conserved hypothetical protein [Colletotrichum sublineola]